MTSEKQPVTLIEWRTGTALIDRDCISSSRLDKGDLTISEFLADKLDTEWSDIAEGDTIVIRSGWVETKED